MSTRRCGKCGEIGHDKRRCSFVETDKVDIDHVFLMYISTDNGDSVTKRMDIFKTIEGVREHVVQLHAKFTEETQEMEDDDEEKFTCAIPDTLDGIIFRVGTVGAAACFACNVLVEKHPLGK